MQITPLVGLALLLGMPSVCLNAQNELGYTTGQGSTNFVSRGWLGQAPGEVYSRIDSGDYAGIGHDPAAPGMISIMGLECDLYDFDSATIQEDYWLVVRTEGGIPDEPDVTGAPAGKVGPFFVPMGTGGAGQHTSATFATPITIPAGRDAFVGIEYSPGPATAGAAGGASYGYITLMRPVNGRYDEPGPALDRTTTSTDSYGLTYDVAATPLVRVNSRRIWHVEPVTMAAGGQCVATADQSTMPSSLAPPGIAGPGTGLHPDLNDHLGATPARLDDPGYMFQDALVPGANVFILLSTNGLSPAPIPLDGIIPGSRGTFCLNDGLTVAAVVADANGVAFVNLALPAGIRAVLGGSGAAVAWTGIAIDANRLILSGGPCGVQTF